jgi:hypothetical protein
VSVFISYSKDLDRVRSLVQALRRHGLRTWRDQDSLEQGAATEAAIEAELARCTAAMIWLGGNTLDSEFVCKNELPLIFEHHRTRGLRIVPLFVDLDVATGNDQIRAATGQEIGIHNGYRFGAASSFDADLAEVASREVQAALRQRARVAEGRRPIVRCVTRSDAARRRDEADLNFDWIKEYPADGSLPDTATVDALRNALRVSSHHLIAAFGPGTVDLYLKCHLHVGVAIGYELRRVTGLRPRVDVDGASWDIDAEPALSGDDRLVYGTTNGQAGGSRTAVEICLTRNVSPMVNEYAATTNTAYRRRTRLEPVGGPSQLSVNPGNVNTWAEQAAEAIRSLKSLPGVQTVHVFMAVPIGFAVALGWRLNAVGGVHLFHPVGDSGPYASVWTVPDSSL